MADVGGSNFGVRQGTDPFTGTQPRSKCTLCPKGVWCSGRIPTEVLAHKINVLGETPVCRYCTQPFVLPPGFKNKNGGSKGNGKGAGGKGGGKGKGGAGGFNPFATPGASPFQTSKEFELQKQLKAAKDLLAANKIVLPTPPAENSKPNTVADNEIISAYNTCKKLGFISDDLQKKYDEIQNRHKQVQEIKSVAVLDQQLQKAEKQLEKYKDEHAKLLVWLHNNTVNGATLSAKIEEIKQNKVELLAKQGFQQKSDSMLLEQPQNMSDGQNQKWAEVTQKYEMEQKQEEDKRKKKYNEELQKLQEAFEAENKAVKEKQDAEKVEKPKSAEEGGNADAENSPKDPNPTEAIPMEQEDALDLEDEMENKLADVQKQMLENMQKYDEGENTEGASKRLKLPSGLGEHARNYASAVSATRPQNKQV
jgi:hypothetical protein